MKCQESLLVVDWSRVEENDHEFDGCKCLEDVSGDNAVDDKGESWSNTVGRTDG